MVLLLTVPRSYVVIFLNKYSTREQGSEEERLTIIRPAKFTENNFHTVESTLH